MSDDYQILSGTKLDTPYILDASHPMEIARITDQSRMLIQISRHAYPKRIDPNRIKYVLDIACATGEWLQYMAHHYEKLELTGLDISPQMIERAEQNKRLRGFNNISYYVMDMLKQPLDFPDHSFDLINCSSIFAVMNPTSWRALFQEIKRLLKPGGTVQLQEPEWGVVNKPALDKYQRLFALAFNRAGRGFKPEGEQFGVTIALPRLLREAGFKNIDRNNYSLDFSYGEQYAAYARQNYTFLLTFLQDFMIEQGVITRPEMDELYTQTLIDLNAPDLIGEMLITQIWGDTPQ